MKKSYKAKNINCQNCANTIMVSLEDDFEDLSVDLNQEPKVVSVNIKDEADEQKFKTEMAELGFEIIGEA